jgi:hypothetical protein
MPACVFKPPGVIDLVPGMKSVFLAGSIEMGKAEDWQSAVTRALSRRDIAILNPRRDEWDASWRQSIDEPMFRQQVQWELDAQEQATLIAMYFAPATQAPITLLELGLFARSGKVVVCCPPGYWRKGNVEVVCDRYDVPLAPDLDALCAEIDRRLYVAPSEAPDQP